MNNVAQNIVGQHKKQRNEWFDGKCRRAIKVKNLTRKIYLQNNTRFLRTEYEEKWKEASKICRRKKKEYLKGKTEQLVEYNNKKDIKKFYKETKDFIQDTNQEQWLVKIRKEEH